MGGLGNMLGPNEPFTAGKQARSVFDQALSEIEDLRRRDVVNLPKAPEPQDNPFANPVVMLGMALQGRSAEAVAAGTQIQRFNRQREDQYRAQVLEAHNYRQLRQQRFATTLAELQTRAAQAELAGRQQAAENIYRAGRDQKTDKLAADQSSRADRALAIQEADFAARNSEQTYITNQDKTYKDDPLFQRFNILRAAFAENEIVDWEADGSMVTKSLDTMSPADRKAAIARLRSQLAFGFNRYYGGAPNFVSEQLGYYNALFDTLDKVEVEHADQMKKLAAEGTPERAQQDELAELQLQRKFEQASPKGELYTDFSTGQGVLDALSSLEGMLQAEEQFPMEKLAAQRQNKGGLQTFFSDPGLGGQDLSTARGATLRVAAEKLAAADPHKDIRAYKGAVQSVVRAAAQEMLSDENKPEGETRSQFTERLKQRLMSEYGIRRGFLDGRSMGQLLKQFYGTSAEAQELRNPGGG